MSKLKTILLLIVAVPAFSFGQETDNSIRSYNVRYEKAHLFLQKDSGFNVIDYDLEWPDILSYGNVSILKSYLSNYLFDATTTSLDTALMTVNETYGSPVSGTFKTIPDDNRFCYVTISSRILSYKQDRWIALELVRKVEPQKLSSFKAEDKRRVIVYDITQDKVMLAEDMIKSGVMQWTAPQDFYDRLFAPLSDEMAETLISAKISGVWIRDGQIFMNVDALSSYGAMSYTVAMPYENYRYILSRESRKMAEKELKQQQPSRLNSLPITINGDTIYNKVEKMPEFNGGNDGLREYLTHVVKPNVSVRQTGRVYVSFVVDKEGNVHDVSVITPVAPEIDRHAAAVIRDLPTLIPGQQNGRKVCVRMYLPITYRP